MVSFSALGFNRKGRKGSTAAQTAPPPPPIQKRAVSPASFFSPARSPLLGEPGSDFLGTVSPLDYGSASGQSSGDVFVVSPRVLGSGTTELRKLELEHTPLSFTDMLPVEMRGHEQEHDYEHEEGKLLAVESKGTEVSYLLPTLPNAPRPAPTLPQSPRPTPSSIPTKRPRRPNPSPIRIPNSSFRPVGVTIDILSSSSRRETLPARTPSGEKIPPLQLQLQPPPQPQPQTPTRPERISNTTTTTSSSPKSSTHSSSLAHITSMFLVRASNSHSPTSHSYSASMQLVRQDSATLPCETPFESNSHPHSTNSTTSQQRRSRAHRSVSRRTSMPTISASPSPFETGDVMARERPMSAISPSPYDGGMPSPLPRRDGDAFDTGTRDEEGAREHEHRPASKPLPDLPSQGFLSPTSNAVPSGNADTHSTPTSGKGTSSTGTGGQHSASGGSSPPTSPSYYVCSPGPSSATPGMSSKMALPLSARISALRPGDVLMTPSGLFTNLSSVQEVDTPASSSTADGPRLQLHDPTAPSQRPISRTLSTNNNDDTASQSSSSLREKLSALPQLMLPIGVSDPVTRKRNSFIDMGPVDVPIEQERPTSSYGRIPPSTLAPAPAAAVAGPSSDRTTPASGPRKSTGPKSKPPPLSRSITEQPFASFKSPVRPVRRKTHVRQKGSDSSTGFPSPPMVVSYIPKRESSAFPSTPRAFSPLPGPSPAYPPPLPPSAPRRALPAPTTETPASPPTTGESSTSQFTTASRPPRARPGLPIGPRKCPGRANGSRPSVPSRAPPSTPAPAPSILSSPPPGSAPSILSASMRSTADPPNSSSSHMHPPRSYSPTFNPRPIAWRGLTLEAAQWTYTSEQLQEIVGRAIRLGSEASSIRLLNPELLDTEIPEEEERLEAKRDQLKTKLRQNSRRRRLLLRELGLASDVPTCQKLANDLSEENAAGDQLGEEFYAVNDQLAQISQLRGAHTSSALSIALRKLNSSLVRAKSMVAGLESQVETLQAERNEAWDTAESVEQQLNDLHKQLEDIDTPKVSTPPDSEDPPSDSVVRASLVRSSSTRSSRSVSAARKASIRASKASLRSSRKSTRSSDGISLLNAAIAWPRPPTMLGGRSSGSSDEIPPVPPMPSLTGTALSRTPSTSAQRPGSYDSRQLSAISASQDYLAAQHEVYSMLGLSEPQQASRDLRRTRSMSDCGSPVPGSARSTFVSPIDPTFANIPASPSLADALRCRPRRSFSIHGSTLMSLGRVYSVQVLPEVRE